MAVREVDGDLMEGEDLMIAKDDRGDPVDVDLALDRRRRLVRMHRGRVTAVDHIVPMQADPDVVRAVTPLNEFIAVVDIDRVMAATEDRVMAVAACDRVMPGSGNEQVVAMGDLKKIGPVSTHQSVGRGRIRTGIGGSMRPITMVVSVAATQTAVGLIVVALIEAADERRSSGASFQQARPATDERVLPRAADQCILAAAGDQDIFALRYLERLGSCPADQS